MGWCWIREERGGREGYAGREARVGYRGRREMRVKKTLAGEGVVGRK